MRRAAVEGLGRVGGAEVVAGLDWLCEQAVEYGMRDEGSSIREALMYLDRKLYCPYYEETQASS